MLQLRQRLKTVVFWFCVFLVLLSLDVWHQAHAVSIVSVPDAAFYDTSFIAFIALVFGIICLALLLWYANRKAAQETSFEPLGGPLEDSLVRMKAWLEFPENKMKSIPLTKSLVRIGRHQDNDVCLRGPAVHSHHAILQLTSDGLFVIADLNGHDDFGVYVNNVKSDRTILYNNDVIRFGGVPARFRIAYREVRQLKALRPRLKSRAC